MKNITPSISRVAWELLISAMSSVGLSTWSPVGQTPSPETAHCVGKGKVSQEMLGEGNCLIAPPKTRSRWQTSPKHSNERKSPQTTWPQSHSQGVESWESSRVVCRWSGHWVSLLVWVPLVWYQVFGICWSPSSSHRFPPCAGLFPLEGFADCIDSTLRVKRPQKWISDLHTGK